MNCRAKSAGWMLLLTLLVLMVMLTAAGWNHEAYGAEKTGTVAIDALNVRTGAGTLNQAIGLIYMGEKVTITGEEKDYAGTVWYQIQYNGGTGYVSSDYIALDSQNQYVNDEAFEAELDAEGFPESYKPYLRQLHADYPNWVFRAAHTGLAWSDAVDAESRPGVSLITGTAAASWKSTDPGAYDSETGVYIQYDSGNWVTAARPVIEYYMDPRNFLNSSGIFQFMAHSYDKRTQNAKGLQGVLNSTFMSGSFPEESHDTYNDVLMEIGKETGVNPYVLASMILVEQGSSGNGKSISGTVAGYEGYYNHFNVGAYASGNMDAVTRGLWYASRESSYGRPWNSIYKSILGGASYYSDNYVKNNKYTLYFKKFNVLNGLANVGKGQYMTNIQGAESEAAALRKGYLNVMSNAMTFVVPVYQDMPASACLKPKATASNDNYLASLSVKGYTLSPVFDRNQTTYHLEIPASVKNVEVTAKANHKGATVSGTGIVSLTAGQNVVNIVVKAASGVKKTYTVNINCVSEDPDGFLRSGVEASTVKLSSVLNEGSISLSWTKSDGFDVDYYEVYRSLKRYSGFGTKAYYTTASGKETSFTDSRQLEPGTMYYYKVYGVKLIDGEKVYTKVSNKAWRKTKAAETPVEPEEPQQPAVSGIAAGVMNTTLTADISVTEKGKLQVNWKKSPGYKVDYYEVYRREGASSQYGETAYFTTSSGDRLYYINTKGLKAGNTYYYKIRGARMVDGQLYYTEWSNEVFGTIAVPEENPAEPESEDPTGAIRIGVQASTIQMSSSFTARGKIRLDWSKSPGYDVDYYEVYRSTQRYKGYGTTPYFVSSNPDNLYYINSKDLISGNTYYYKVRGVRIIDGVKVYTKYSNKSWRTIQ